MATDLALLTVHGFCLLLKKSSVQGFLKKEEETQLLTAGLPSLYYIDPSSFEMSDFSGQEGNNRI